MSRFEELNPVVKYFQVATLSKYDFNTLPTSVTRHWLSHVQVVCGLQALKFT